MGCARDLTPNVPDYLVPHLQRPPTVETQLQGLPKDLTCPYCDAHVETAVEYKVGSNGYIMCMFTMPCLLCWVPFVASRFKDAKHSCPSCKQLIGKFNRF